MRDVWPQLARHRFPAVRRDRIDCLQLNLGYLCNLSCLHCHVNAGPHRKELMDRATMQLALDVAEARAITRFDLTGGSPEMNPHFRWLVSTARARGIAVIDRLNPTIAEVDGYQWVPEFLAEQGVEVVASLPCHSQANVDSQRGDGVFESSIRVLRRLNELGYGRPGSGLTLNLVYNPGGAFLPPPQALLEADYKCLLEVNFGIFFNSLYALANMPVKRFGSQLLSKGQFEPYMDLLKAAHRDDNLASVMCRSLISVDWRGFLYDCDFNQMLDMPLGGEDSARHLSSLLTVDPPPQVAVNGHCYGCTAGQGSSCGGAFVEPAIAAA